MVSNEVSKYNLFICIVVWYFLVWKYYYCNGSSSSNRRRSIFGSIEEADQGLRILTFHVETWGNYDGNSNFVRPFPLSSIFFAFLRFLRPSRPASSLFSPLWRQFENTGVETVMRFSRSRGGIIIALGSTRAPSSSKHSSSSSSCFSSSFFFFVEESRLILK